MTKKSFFRVLAQLVVVVIIAICAWRSPLSYKGYVTGLVGVIVVDIYGTLIEKGKL